MASLVDRALDAAVEHMGGVRRDGQHDMANALADSLASGEHLLVQAGTGTGKSLGYLIPALVHVVENPDARVIVATATLALQAQLASKDIPAALRAVEQVTGSTPRTTILKGRSNYACLHKVRSGGLEQDSLFDGGELAGALKASNAGADSVLGAEVLALRSWAEQELDDKHLADRDDAPPHSARAWLQVSVSVRECLGAAKCPFGQECFVEKSRMIARESDLVVTNHALLAIDAMHGGTALPEHDVVIIDEAHELTSRVTGAASSELSPQIVERTARRALDFLNDDLGMDFLELADDFTEALDASEVARVEDPDSPLVTQFQRIRDVSRRIVSAIGGEEASAEEKQAQAAVKEIFDVAERMAKLATDDVVWVSERERQGRWCVVAPLDVAGLLREKVLATSTVALTSATLKLGGDFLPAARTVGLHKDDTAMPWRGIDVGTPFDYPRQGICYVATHLPNPSRDGIGEEQLATIAELVWAAGGRTLGLFSSQRSAELAAAHVRRELPKTPVLCQGDAHLPDLLRQFTADPETCLFGTVSLWQGVDVPGDTCELVIIDKIPFPRPDEPLLQARQAAVAQSGGNGFMQVAATHAALLLAQGSGRLIRRSSDRGVVAVLDPRLLTARYGSFLRASMPDFWLTTDQEQAVGALRRLQEARKGS